MHFPKDPVILLSYVNTQLRDFYADLEALCDAGEITREELTQKLGTIGYHYDAESNQFKAN